MRIRERSAEEKEAALGSAPRIVGESPHGGSSHHEGRRIQPLDPRRNEGPGESKGRGEPIAVDDPRLPGDDEGPPCPVSAAAGSPSPRVRTGLAQRRRRDGAQDGRHAPQISAGTVAEAVWFMGALGLGSLLQCDQQVRTAVGQQWFGQARAVVSDTTMSRSLEGMTLAPIRSLLVSAYHRGRRSGLSKWDGVLGKHRVGIVDGTCFGSYMASCLEIVGASALLLNMEPIPKRGKELPAS